MDSTTSTADSGPRGLRWRPVFLGGMTLLIITQIVALSPSSLEEPPRTNEVQPELVLQEANPKTMRAQGIPTHRIPDYTITQFRYASTQNGQKQWKMHAEKAHMYNQEDLVHATHVTAWLYDSSEKITLVTGLEAKYSMKNRDLEVYGDVNTVFPDGFETRSQYLRYLPNQKWFHVPETEPVSGRGKQEKGQRISFTSKGMDYQMSESMIYLKREVHFVMTRKTRDEVTGKETLEDTVIDSDSCSIDRAKQFAQFTMEGSRPLNERLVQINQPQLFTRSRTADLNYGDYATLLNYMTAHDDVLIKEKGNSSLRYATGGRADFDSKKNVVVLTKFPQVYQDNDTVTGDIVTLHRDTDVVEVEHSNAFSEGQKENEGAGVEGNSDAESESEPGPDGK